MKPKHVGIIMDGNRRFSKRLMKKPWEGHILGREKLSDVMQWCRELDITELTVFALSTQNFSRPQKEFNYLMELFQSGIQEILRDSEKLLSKNLQFRFIGNRELLPEPIPSLMQELELLTAEQTPYTINVAIAYGGQEEITAAVKKIVSKKLPVEKIRKETILQHLQLQNSPDLIIRTGGEQRISNFLTWQSTYSELIFLEKLWPEFTKEDFVHCIEEFSQRERRFGK